MNTWRHFHAIHKAARSSGSKTAVSIRTGALFGPLLLFWEVVMAKKKAEINDTAFANPVFAFGLDETAKPRGARFTQGLNDRVASAALDMNCRVIQNHSVAFNAIGMKLP